MLTKKRVKVMKILSTLLIAVSSLGVGYLQQPKNINTVNLQAVTKSSIDIVDYDKTIYIKTDSWTYGSSSYRFAARFRNADYTEETWVEVSSINYTTRCRSFTIPDGDWPHFQVCMMPYSDPTNNYSLSMSHTYTLDTHPGIYQATGKKVSQAYGSWQSLLKVGGKTYYMVPNGEQNRLVVNVDANDDDSIQYYQYDGSANPTTLAQENSAEMYCSNNFYNQNVKVGGHLLVTLQTVNYFVQITGYHQESHMLNVFCEVMLRNCTYNAYNDAKSTAQYLSDQDKAAFNSATIVQGNNVSYSQYGNIINEAATRYLVYLNKGYDPIDGITISNNANGSRFITLENSDNNESLITLSSCLAISFAALTLVLVIAKKRRAK